MATPDTLRSIQHIQPPSDALVDAYLRRATEPSVRPPVRDTVYSGAPTLPRASTTQPARNRAAAKRSISPFSIVIALIITAVVSVMYISNIIAVTQLVATIGDLETKVQRQQNEQELLRAQISRMSSLERIRQMAEKDLGMRNSEAVPGWISIDPERVNELQQKVDRNRPPR